MKQIKKLQAKGLYDNEKEDPFELFISSTNIRWCYYKETSKILGNTYGMLILQDFESMTPNILCRTIETVEGGGVVVLLLRTMSSLRQLYSMVMEVHSRFTTEAYGNVVPRFNERFLLSLATCPVCLVLDDELNVLPVSRHAKHITPIENISSSSSSKSSNSNGIGSIWSNNNDPLLSQLGLVESGIIKEAELTPAQKELKELKSSLANTELVGSLVNCTKTLDQAKAVLTFCEGISEKTLRSTVALTAGRGRGKSSALGLSIAAAIGYGYSNIFVTSPSPENLKTLFEFIFKGLEALSFREHTDYEAIASTNPEFGNAIVRVNIFRGHRQTVQYIDPRDADKLTQAELVVIDEAAAIPLPLVKRLLGPYLVFIASTVNGYEGTGRSLSLKLVQQLRQQQMNGNNSYGNVTSTSLSSSSSSSGALPGSSNITHGRTFREVTLSEPIRYAAGDGVEKWLNDFLCLDATTPPKLNGKLPAPASCELYAVDRDSLFSYHKAAEAFLHNMMSLYVSSHYKNSPNDLQLMSDAPAHRLFVLLGPQNTDQSTDIPDILCVIQVCLEGKISSETIRATLGRGARSSGDLIPWTVSQQFQDDNFGSLSGARVVRIATHPDATKMGYGTRALELLTSMYEGRLVSLGTDEDEDDNDIDVDRGIRHVVDDDDNDDDNEKDNNNSDDENEQPKTRLQKEKIKARKDLPPLLVPVTEFRKPTRLHYLGVGYGLTLQLFNFWKRSGYYPVYLRQTANDLTAEHTMIMLHPLQHIQGALEGDPLPGWHTGFVGDFAHRYMNLLSYDFRNFDTTLALTVMDAACSIIGGGSASGGNATDNDDDNNTNTSNTKTSTALVSTTTPSADNRIPNKGEITAQEILFLFTPHDLKRLESYARSLVDYHMILDLLPTVARLFFMGRLPSVGLPRLQAGILLAVGLQHVEVDTVSIHFDVATNQVLALFNKSLRKISTALHTIYEKAAEAKLENSFVKHKQLNSPPSSNSKANNNSSSTKTDKVRNREIDNDNDEPDTKKGKLNNSSSSSSSNNNTNKLTTLLSESDLQQYAIPSTINFDDTKTNNNTSKNTSKYNNKDDSSHSKKHDRKHNEDMYSGRTDLLKNKGHKHK